MYSRIFWLPCDAPGRLAILSRPSGEWLADEVTAWREAGVSVVVCLLEAHEQAELGLLREADQCRAHAIEFVSFPIADRGVPASPQDLATLAHRLARAIAAGSIVGVHCRAGIGRSAIMTASILMALGQSADAALELITKARGVSVPDTSEQRDWLRSVGASLLRR
jgi:protein-tyrosine phosphatase